MTEVVTDTVISGALTTLKEIACHLQAVSDHLVVGRCAFQERKLERIGVQSVGEPSTVDICDLFISEWWENVIKRKLYWVYNYIRSYTDNVILNIIEDCKVRKTLYWRQVIFEGAIVYWWLYDILRSDSWGRVGRTLWRFLAWEMSHPFLCEGAKKNKKGLEEVAKMQKLRNAKIRKTIEV